MSYVPHTRPLRSLVLTSPASVTGLLIPGQMLVLYSTTLFRVCTTDLSSVTMTDADLLNSYYLPPNVSALVEATGVNLFALAVSGPGTLYVNVADAGRNVARVRDVSYG